MPRNNNWWTEHYATGIDIVKDGTRPMMVHFTRDQMVNNNITTTGDGSDFEILTRRSTMKPPSLLTSSTTKSSTRMSPA